MNRQQAMARLRKLYGAAARISTHRTAPRDADDAAALRAQHAEAKAAATAAREAADARRDAILAADAEYQRLRAHAAALRVVAEKSQGWHAKPYHVGESVGFAMYVHADGYTLREAVENAERKHYQRRG
jgi:hypothetical protein